MQFRLASILAAVVAAIGVSAMDLIINTPADFVQCEPQLITWSGGEAPYFVRQVYFARVTIVQPGGQPEAPPIVNFGEQTGTSLTWDVNVTAGTSIGLQALDKTGAIANSAPFTVGPSSDASCLEG